MKRILKIIFWAILVVLFWECVLWPHGAGGPAGAQVAPAVRGSDFERWLVYSSLPGRPDLLGEVVDISFVEPCQLVRNTDRGVCHWMYIGEADVGAKVVRLVHTSLYWHDLRVFMEDLYHELVHVRMWRTCGRCTEDEERVELCAIDRSKCPW